MINIKTNLILPLVLVLLASHASAQAIKGTITYTKWKEFNTTLWTFHVHPKTDVYDPSTEIVASYSERVSAFAMQDQKMIHSLPVRVVSKFPNLKVYEAYNCSIVEIAKENFEDLVHLRAVDLQHNELIAVPETAFDDQSHLVFLNLAHNKILRIFENSFKNLKALRMLYLGWNQIEILPKNLFTNLQNLRKVGLTSNQIKRIASEHFENNSRLAYIWLNENKIEVIEDEGIFEASMSSLKRVDMELNRCINKAYSGRDLDTLARDIKRNCKRR